jgi:UDP-glucose:(heptosyl)LPS alpha-1,3-glucosyltransferase
MSALRIALIRQRYNPYGGAERFVANAMQALQERGAEITIVTRKWQPQPGVQALVLNPFYVGSLWRDRGFSSAVCSALQQQAFNLVQSHERIACCDVYRAGDGVHREWLRQRRRVLSPFGRLRIALNPYHRYLLAAERRLFHNSRVRAIICISQMVKREIMQHYGVAEDRLHVVYNGVDTQAFHPRLKQEYAARVRAAFGIPEDATVFLFVGSGFERKGIPALLEVMSALPPHAHLLIVGRDKALKKYQRISASRGLSTRVHFAGGQSDVKPFYGTADALAFPTLYEPFGNVVLEAMACGLPVITSTKAGAAEVIEDGVNGYVCDALDVLALARAMEALCSRERCVEMGAAARRTVEPYTFDAMSQRLITLYESLLGTRQATSEGGNQGRTI